MRLSHVLTAVNANPKYYRFVPAFIARWRALAPDLTPLIILCLAEGEEIPEALHPWLSHMIPYYIPKSISTAYAAQTIRLLWPAIIQTEGAVLITDIDMIPMSRDYFVRSISHISDDVFVSYRPESTAGSEEIMMCYCAATPRIWGEYFEISCLSDIREALLKVAAAVPVYDGEHGGRGWTTDQRYLWNRLHVPGRRVVYLDDSKTDYKRLDFWDFRYSVERLNEIIADSSAGYTDCHFYADACPWDLNEILQLRLDRTIYKIRTWV